MAPVLSTTTMYNIEEGEGPISSMMVRGFNPNEVETVIKNFGKFDSLYRIESITFFKKKLRAIFRHVQVYRW